MERYYESTYRNKNPGKIKGARSALENFYKDVEIEGVSVPSGVNEQPVNKETYICAVNRVKNLMQLPKSTILKLTYIWLLNQD